MERSDQRQSSCDLRFGTSTGALGLRKFPNPRFDSGEVESAEQRPTTWEGYRRLLVGRPEQSRFARQPAFDGSIEPPFRIGMACGACHIAYDPLNPPADPNHPKWENIDGLVGNQYSRVSKLLGSGMSPHRLEWQLIALARPGIVDTSALPMDQVSNPGTMNAIINFAARPLHEQRILKWRKASACPAGADPASAGASRASPDKCWERSEKTEMVPNILKGGEDSIGVNEAIQRVYFNIGSLRRAVLDQPPDRPACRRSGPAQLRPDAVRHRPVPARLRQLPRDRGPARRREGASSSLHARPTSGGPATWPAARSGGRSSTPSSSTAPSKRGRKVFADNCARCHSSQPGPYDNADFHATRSARSDIAPRLARQRRAVACHARSAPIPARALHSNHMRSRVWAAVRLADLARTGRPTRLLPRGDEGRRPRLLPQHLAAVSAWAHAPFMHNNAIGPEICGKPKDPAVDFYFLALRRRERQAACRPAACWAFDPERRGPLQALQGIDGGTALSRPAHAEDVRSSTGTSSSTSRPKIKIGDLETRAHPDGYRGASRRSTLNILRFKDLLQDLVLVGRDPGQFEAKYATLLSAEQREELRAGLMSWRTTAARGISWWPQGGRRPGQATAGRQRLRAALLLQRCCSPSRTPATASARTSSDDEKQALIAFVATL